MMRLGIGIFFCNTDLHYKIELIINTLKEIKLPSNILMNSFPNEVFCNSFESVKCFL